MFFTTVVPFLYHFPGIVEVHGVIYNSSKQGTVFVYAYCYEIQSIG